MLTPCVPICGDGLRVGDEDSRVPASESRLVDSMPRCGQRSISLVFVLFCAKVVGSLLLTESFFSTNASYARPKLYRLCLHKDCDYNNTEPGDGCSPTCEAGWGVGGGLRLASATQITA